jgi:hypothetical protein
MSYIPEILREMSISFTIKKTVLNSEQNVESTFQSPLKSLITFKFNESRSEKNGEPLKRILKICTSIKYIGMYLLNYIRNSNYPIRIVSFESKAFRVISIDKDASNHHRNAVVVNTKRPVYNRPKSANSIQLSRRSSSRCPSIGLNHTTSNERQSHTPDFHLPSQSKHSPPASSHSSA